MASRSLFQSQPHSRLYRPQRLVEPLGDLRVSQSFEIGQLDDRSLFGAKGAERLFQDPPVEPGGRKADRVAGIVGRNIKCLYLSRRPVLFASPSPPDLIDSAMMRDAKQPRGDRAAASPVAVGASPGR